MTKQEILDEFNDINFVYNNSSKHETLSTMLDELLKEHEADCGKDKNEPLKISRDWVDEFYGYVAVCPECDCFWIMYRDEDMKFCPGCGQEVKWE